VSRSTPSFPTSAGSGPLNILNQSLAQPLPNIPAGVSYADMTRSGTIVLISQPRGQRCAVVGGIMAARMGKMGARGVLVDGRVRDLDALGAQAIPVGRDFALATDGPGERKAAAREERRIPGFLFR
jgi:regulator of RNase E activity RraA